MGFMTGPSESVTKPPTTRVANRGNQDRMVLARQRDLKAIELRLAGYTFQQMAEQMGFKDHSQAYRCWARAMASQVAENVDELRQLEDARLDALWAPMFTKAKAGNHLAVDRCLMIMARRARLWGLDAPVKRFVEVTGLNQLVRAVENLEQENEAMEARIADRMAGIDADEDICDADLIDESPCDGETQLPSDQEADSFLRSHGWRSDLVAGATPVA